ncbi:MAG: T9SS type A sorting domain-containing protein, partial [Saprospiraceae bacterium]|nr:T9SS type A sorting domain-containing protein [Saprospiraceae bacterium]
EHSMTLIGMLKVSGVNASTATMELGAFASGQVRGTGQAIYVEPLQAYLFFLTVYSNSSGEQIRYKLFDSSTGAVQDLSEVMSFSPDLHQGSIENPVPFSLPSSGTYDLALAKSFEVQPNPFHTETLIRFALTEAQEVHLGITDINGKLVAHWGAPAREGMNTMVWKGISDSGSQLPSGVYFIRLQTDSGNVVKKVVLQ